MPAYAYPITIKYAPQIVRSIKEIDITDEVLTLEFLSKYVKQNESFGIHTYYPEENYFEEKTQLLIYKKRYETEEELATRVKKEERYMGGYRKFHSNKKKLL